MNAFQGPERRRHNRYETDLEIKFNVKFDLHTNIDFRLKDEANAVRSEVYRGVGHNISVEGLGFSSQKKLKKGDVLIMDVYVPASKDPIQMEGRVLWCELDPKKDANPQQYFCGVKILKVKGEDVEGSIALDPVHRILWSIVLESVFGGFKENILKGKKK